MIRETRMHVYTSRWLVQQTLCHGRNVGGYVGLYVCLYICIYGPRRPGQLTPTPAQTSKSPRACGRLCRLVGFLAISSAYKTSLQGSNNVGLLARATMADIDSLMEQT